MSGYAADAQSILRCGQCHKPFDKQSTLKRHLYYCRSRKAGNTLRSRSCIPCARGKTACDTAKPHCSRCASKSLRCYYPGSLAKPPVITGTSSFPSETPNSDSIRETSEDGNLGLFGGLDMPTLEFVDLGDAPLEWDGDSMMFADLFPAHSAESHVSSCLLSLELQSPSPIAGTHQAIPQPQQQQQMVALPPPSIPAAPTSSVRTLVRRPKMHPGTQRVSNLVLHTLKSYPLMISRHDALPPFIHPLCADVEDPYMEPLTNCLSLTHMITGSAQGSRKLFWKNVRMECERFSHEHEKLNKWELLSAMHALSIYILIRLNEGETDYNNFDSLLVKTFIAIAQQLGQTDVTCYKQCGSCNDGLQLSWKEWVYRESRRRLAIIYRVVNMLIYFEPASMCNMPAEFILAPLPAAKGLWEASDEFSWKAASQKQDSQLSYGLASDGEIVELDDRRLSCNDAWLSHESADARIPSRRSIAWEEWCAGIDGLGGLVMLAASLVG